MNEKKSMSDEWQIVWPGQSNFTFYSLIIRWSRFLCFPSNNRQCDHHNILVVVIMCGSFSWLQGFYSTGCFTKNVTLENGTIYFSWFFSFLDSYSNNFGHFLTAQVVLIQKMFKILIVQYQNSKDPPCCTGLYQT